MTDEQEYQFTEIIMLCGGCGRNVAPSFVEQFTKELEKEIYDDLPKKVEVAILKALLRGGLPDTYLVVEAYANTIAAQYYVQGALDLFIYEREDAIPPIVPKKG